MKTFYSKLSALGAVLVVGTAFAAADTITLASWATGTPIPVGVNAGQTAVKFTATTTSVPVGTGSTATLNPGGVWVNPSTTFAPSTWVGINACTQPGGNCSAVPGIGSVFAPDGNYTFTSTFNAANGVQYTGQFNIAADDTVDVFLNGVLFIKDSVGSPSDGDCESNMPDCTGIDRVPWSFTGSGLETLTFVVEQVGSISTGFDFEAQVTSVPEPSTLMMLGTGLVGAAGTLFRRRKA